MQMGEVEMKVEMEVYIYCELGMGCDYFSEKPWWDSWDIVFIHTPEYGKQRDR